MLLSLVLYFNISSCDKFQKLLIWPVQVTHAGDEIKVLLILFLGCYKRTTLIIFLPYQFLLYNVQEVIPLQLKDHLFLAKHPMF